MPDNNNNSSPDASSTSDQRIGDEYFHQTIDAEGLFHPSPGEQPTDPHALGPWHIVHQQLDEESHVVLLWRRPVDFAAVEAAGLLIPLEASSDEDSDAEEATNEGAGADDPENTLQTEIVERQPDQVNAPGGLVAQVSVKEISAPPIPPAPTPVDLSRYPDRTRHQIPGPGGIPPITAPTAPVPAHLVGGGYAVRPAAGAPPIEGYAPPGPIQHRMDPPPTPAAGPMREHTVSPEVDPAVSFPRAETSQPKREPFDVASLSVSAICRCERPKPQRTTNGAEVCTACRKRHLTPQEREQLRSALA